MADGRVDETSPPRELASLVFGGGARIIRDRGREITQHPQAIDDAPEPRHQHREDGADAVEEIHRRHRQLYDVHDIGDSFSLHASPPFAMNAMHRARANCDDHNTASKPSNCGGPKYISRAAPACACARRKASDLVHTSKAARDSQMECDANSVQLSSDAPRSR